MADAIRIGRTPPVFEVTLDRPPANAIDAATSRELGRVFAEFRDDPTYRVAILTGAGDRFFSAGWDLHAAAAGEAADADFGEGGFGGFPELPGLAKPVIAAVNGLAVGGGCELVLAADLAVAADTAEFALPEATIGVVPDVGSVLLPHLVPRARALELLLTGRRFTAAEASSWGLLNRVVPAAELMGVARTLAGEIAVAAPLAVAAVLELARISNRLGAAAALERVRSGEVEPYQRMLRSDDAREGPQAFAERRSPRWTGR